MITPHNKADGFQPAADNDAGQSTVKRTLQKRAFCPNRNQPRTILIDTLENNLNMDNADNIKLL